MRLELRSILIVSALPLCASALQAQTVIALEHVPVGGGKRIVYIDRSTGVLTDPGTVGDSISPPLSTNGVTAVDPVANVFYFVGTTGVETNERIWTVALGTGSASTNPAIPGSATMTISGPRLGRGRVGPLCGARRRGRRQAGRDAQPLDRRGHRGEREHRSVAARAGMNGGMNTLDATGNRFFFVGVHLDDSLQRLFVVDSTDGSVDGSSLIQDAATNPILCIDWDAAQGVLHAIRNSGSGARGVVSINPATGAVTATGAGTGTSVGTSNAPCALDSAANEYVMVGFAGAEVLQRGYAFDTTDGSFTVSAPIPGSDLENLSGLEVDTGTTPVSLLELTID